MNNVSNETAIKQCADSFEHFCKYLKVHDPTHELVPFQLYDYKKRVISAYESKQFVILKKFRQGGFSTLTDVYLLWKALFGDADCHYAVVSKTDREAIFHQHRVKHFIDRLPDWMKPKLIQCNNHQIIFQNGSRITFYPVGYGRGCAVAIMFIDEPAFIRDMDRHWKSIYPCFSTGGKCFAVSTPNENKGWFYKTYTEALKHENQFYAVHCSYEEHPKYNDPLWKDETRKRLGFRGWRQEVLSEFIPEQTLDERFQRGEEFEEEVSNIEHICSFSLGRRVENEPRSTRMDESFKITNNIEPIMLTGDEEPTSERQKPEVYQWKTLTKAEIHEQFEKEMQESRPTIKHPEFEEPMSFTVEGLSEFWLELKELDEQYAAEANIWLKQSKINQDELKWLEKNLAEYTDFETLTRAGIALSTEDKLFQIGKSPEVQILDRVTDCGEFPDMYLAFFDGQLCINKVPTVIREEDCRDLYNGMLSFHGYEKAIETVVEAIKNELMKLFRKE